MIEIKNRFTGEVMTTVDAQYLSGANLRGANLSEADLREADLREADLSGANLRGANLRGANLSEANLRGANLSEADLSEADLREADLSGANLRGANLSGANLREANLSGANLREADLSGANLRGANLSGANLSGALNVPPVEVIPDLRQRILAQVTGESCSLNMSTWHTCETTHCLAGWATTLHPQGRLLESLIGVNAAGALIFSACCGEVPDFYSTDDEAMAWLRKPAAVTN